jgi:hypothetical protein
VTPWERGVGPVLGCATGAAAAAIAAERVFGRPLGSEGAKVRQPGGTIEVRWDAAARILEMTGSARLIATGRIALDAREPAAEGAATRAGPAAVDMERSLAGVQGTG